MKEKTQDSRRKFLKQISTTAAAAAVVPASLAQTGQTATYLPLVKRKKISANDNIRIALIGTGGMGMGDSNTAFIVEGVAVVAACGVYGRRLIRAKELWGKALFTAIDYREILDRADVDCVLNATTDHGHEVVAIVAL